MNSTIDDLVFYYPEGHEKHFEAEHPERPERVESIRTSLEEYGYWDAFPKQEPSDIPDQVMLAVHSEQYLNALEEVCKKGMHYDADTYTRPESWQLAHKTAGGAISVASEVWNGNAKRGFALTRPPGHHATPNRAMGFCLLNNVALAAQYLITIGDAKNLMIIDLDLHHGNGTQEIFYTRKDVFYLSTHQYPHYPGTGWLNETGVDQGEMMTANFPLPPYSGDSAFFKVMDEVIIPLLNRVKPEMILVSYGFDPHFADPLGNLQLTGDGYGRLIESLVLWADENCNGRISLFLEGGYDLGAARECSLAVVAALLGERSYQQTSKMATNRKPKNFNSILEQVKRLWEIS
jgi:acetoin utilization deacetylase AcuC-like enzyme